jgi:hypothetical protein
MYKDIWDILIWTLNLIFMDPRIVDDSVEIPTRCRFVIEFIIPKFIEGSTCFERHTAHHLELCVCSLWFIYILVYIIYTKSFIFCSI